MSEARTVDGSLRPNGPNEDLPPSNSVMAASAAKLTKISIGRSSSSRCGVSNPDETRADLVHSEGQESRPATRNSRADSARRPSCPPAGP